MIRHPTNGRPRLRLRQITWKQALGRRRGAVLRDDSGHVAFGRHHHRRHDRRHPAQDRHRVLVLPGRCPRCWAQPCSTCTRTFGALTQHDLSGIAVGFLAAFLSAMVVVRAVLRFVANHTYRVFAWYRIVFGAVVAAWIFTR